MAYKQNNNPFKKLHGDLQGFGERHAAWRAKREAMPQKKYGHFSEGSKAYRAGKKSGESKFQYDIRMRKEGRGTSGTESSSTFQAPDPKFQAPDPKHEINIEGADTPSWEYKTQERNPGDLRVQVRTVYGNLPSAPGDPYDYSFNEKGDVYYWNPEGEAFYPERGSTADKAIRERYTGSETGDISSWYGYDSSTDTYSYKQHPEYGEDYAEGDLKNYGSTRKKSYLPYDLAMKHFGPGSTKKK